MRRIRLVPIGLAILATALIGCAEDKPTATTSQPTDAATTAAATAAATASASVASSPVPVSALTVTPPRYEPNRLMKDLESPCKHLGAALGRPAGYPQENLVAAVTGRNFRESAGSYGSGSRDCVLYVKGEEGKLALHLYATTGGQNSNWARLLESGMYRNSTKSYAKVTKAASGLGDAQYNGEGVILVQVGNYAIGVDAEPASTVPGEVLTELAKLMLLLAPQSGQAAV